MNIEIIDENPSTDMDCTETQFEAIDVVYDNLVDMAFLSLKTEAV